MLVELKFVKKQKMRFRPKFTSSIELLTVEALVRIAGYDDFYKIYRKKKTFALPEPLHCICICFEAIIDKDFYSQRI